MISPRIMAAMALVIVLAGGGYWFSNVLSERKELRIENVRLEREIQTAEAIADQAKQSLAVARAYQKAAEEKAQEFNSLRETILRRGSDGPIPDNLCADINRLFPGTCNRDEGGGAERAD